MLRNTCDFLRVRESSCSLFEERVETLSTRYSPCSLKGGILIHGSLCKVSLRWARYACPPLNTQQGGKQTMYVAIRRMKGQPGSIDEAARRIENGLVPILSRVPGFVEYDVVQVGEDE